MTNSLLGTRAAVLKPSATLAISSRAKAMSKEGIDVVSLAAGEPDFDTPQHICKAAEEAIHRGETRYTAAAGIPELRSAAAATIQASTGIETTSDQIIVTCGAKQALFNTMFLTLNPGDRVIIPAPCWVTYPAQVRLAGGTPDIVPPLPNGDLDIDGIISAAEGARALVLCNPSNPTGQVLSSEDLARIGEAALRHDLIVVSDEIYAELVYPPAEFSSLLRTCPDLKDQTVIIHGVSKTYAMTGWRIGYSSAPAPLAAKMGALMSQTTSNPSSIAQWAAYAALEGSLSFLNDWKTQFARRRDLLVSGLRQLPGVECAQPDGAFYVFPSVRELIQQTNCDDDVHFAARLLEEAHVAVVPGTPFGAPGHVRLSYATSEDALKTALSRMESWIGSST